MNFEGTHNNRTLAWARDEIDTVVKRITDQGIIRSPLVEARPAWIKPFDIVIGQVRDQGVQSEFLWIIGGTVPIDFIHSGVATTPRDAARHFSMKWQLEAARYEDPKERKRFGIDPAVNREAQSKTLGVKAEYLYRIVENDQFWL